MPILTINDDESIRVRYGAGLVCAMLVQMIGDDDPVPQRGYRRHLSGFHVDDDPRVIGLDLDDTEIRVFADEPVWSVPSVFGTPLTARQELEGIEVTSTWGDDKFDPLDLVHRDALHRCSERCDLTLRRYRCA